MTLQSFKQIPGDAVLNPGSDPLEIWQKAVKKHGDVSYITSGRFKMYLVNNPAIINEILLTKHKNFTKGNLLSRILGDGLLTSNGEFHHKQKRLIQPAFHQKIISTYADIMTSFTERAISTWKEGEVIDIHGEMMRLAMGIVAKCLFNADTESEWKDVSGAFSDINNYMDRLSRPLGALRDRIPSPSNRRYHEALMRLDKIVYSIIEERRKSGEDAGDLLSILLKARDEAGKQMTDKQLRDEMMTLFLAGYETTANGLTWTWYLLSQNPSVMVKLHREVDTLFSIKNSPKADDYMKLDYTTKVFKEALRLYPPAWRLARIALVDYRVGEYLIPAGSRIIFSPYLIQHDSRFYERAEEFDPDRWTPEMEANLPDFAYFPFGGGPRGCVGEAFAKLEGTVLISTIARKWDLLYESKRKDVELWPGITLRPKHGMPMRLSKPTQSK